MPAMEAVAEKGQLKGYIKPVFRNLDVVSLEKDDENPLRLFWEAIVGTVAEIFEKQPEDQLATKIPLEGRFEEPETDVLPVIGWSTQECLYSGLPAADRTFCGERLISILYRPGSIGAYTTGHEMNGRSSAKSDI